MSCRPRPRKQLLLKLGVFLLLGAIVNVAVAWGVSFTGNPAVGFANLASGTIVNQSGQRKPGASSMFVYDVPSDKRGTMYDLRGWPMYCLGAETYVDHHGTSQSDVCTGGYIIKQSQYSASVLTYPDVLPMRPIWLGIAINTIFFAVILQLLCIVTGKIRRFIIVGGRTRRGCCLACGYKIDSHPGIGPRCSECGHQLRAGVRD